MKPKIVFIILLLGATVRFVEAQTVGEMFIKMPESELLTLTASHRSDLINLYKAGKNATIKNRFEDSCSIISMKEEYLQIRTGNHTLEMFLLPMINDSKIIGLIQTVCAPVCDSQLEFFTTSWKKLTTSVFISFAGKYDFLKEGVNREEEKVKNALIPLDIFLMQLRYNPENRELQQFYTTPDYLSETDRIAVKPYLIDVPKRFKWNLTRFE